ncbi:transcription termination/antitermination factor NusG [Candidatus Dojkabacteria bacterium]|nr:transcription termination/antitermination factor NusG [Candidatus Dojkabacteria bacterium]
MATKKTKAPKKTATKIQEPKIGKETEEPKEEKVTTQIEEKSTKRKKDAPQWYVISTQSGHEQKVADAIKLRVEATELQEIIPEVLVPVQKKIIVKEGKQKVKEEKIFPGYVLIRMVLDQKTWEIITNTEGVTGFIRIDKYPRPLPDEEVKAIMKFMEIEQPAFQASFSPGDAVRITEGAFADFVGSVSEIDETKGKVKVLISIFGRETPVELEFSQVKKL